MERQSYNIPKPSAKQSQVVKEARSYEGLGRQLSDTLLKLKEKITPKAREVRPGKSPFATQRSVSKKSAAAFDEWVRKKHEQLKRITQRSSGRLQSKTSMSKISLGLKHLKLGDEECDVAASPAPVPAPDLKEKDIGEGEGKERLEEYEIKSRKSFISDWEQIKQTSEALKKVEPLRLGRVTGHTMTEPPYLTKYVMKPDPVFQMRYRNVLNEAKTRPQEIILDAPWDVGKDNPARLPARYKNILRLKKKSSIVFINDELK